MAKKPGKSIGKVKKQAMEESLPQNILPVGERVEENKKIYISQSVYMEILKFTKNKTTNESGGMLIGNVIGEFGKTNIIIQGFVEAKYTEATPTTLKFTHETWDYVHLEIERRFDGGQIVGWIHTHPDFGIFLSEYDVFIQKNFFKEDYQIAYVVDPIQHIEGFYFWINGKIERCKGFYIYDKTDKKIDIECEKVEEATSRLATATNTSRPVLLYVLSGVFALAMIILAIVSVNLSNRMSILESRQENLVESANQSIYYLQQQVTSLEEAISDLQSQVDTYHPAKTETESEEGEEGMNSSEEQSNNNERNSVEAKESTGAETTNIDHESEEETVNE